MGCRRRAPKPALVRIARQPGSEVRVDLEATSPGRGAYVHPTEACVEAATRARALARALRRSLSEDEVSKLRADLRRHLGVA